MLQSYQFKAHCKGEAVALKLQISFARTYHKTEVNAYACTSEICS